MPILYIIFAIPYFFLGFKALAQSYISFSVLNTLMIPPSPPPFLYYSCAAPALYIFLKSKTPLFKRDGYAFPGESRNELKIDGESRAKVVYATLADIQRRTYTLLPDSDIVMVHYLPPTKKYNPKARAKKKAAKAAVRQTAEEAEKEAAQQAQQGKQVKKRLRGRKDYEKKQAEQEQEAQQAEQVQKAEQAQAEQAQQDEQVVDETLLNPEEEREKEVISPERTETENSAKPLSAENLQKPPRNRKKKAGNQKKRPAEKKDEMPARKRLKKASGEKKRPAEKDGAEIENPMHKKSTTLPTLPLLREEREESPILEAQDLSESLAAPSEALGAGTEADMSHNPRTLLAIGARLRRPHAPLAIICDGVNSVCSDVKLLKSSLKPFNGALGKKGGKLKEQTVREGTSAVVGVFWDELTPEIHEKVWRGVLKKVPHGEVIDAAVDLVLEKLDSELVSPEVVQALQDASTTSKPAMARALGKLSRSRVLPASSLMALVNYIIGKAPLDWAAVNFEMIRDSVIDRDLEAAKDWIESALANKPTE